MPQQHHQSDPRVLSRRTLTQDHRTLAALLTPGMQVLDIGCGTGAITSGIAEAVGPTGRVLGIDRDPSMIEIAKQDHAHLPNLRFEQGDVLSLNCENQFDIVTAARVLQWISNPLEALIRMKSAAKQNGRVVVLDYNHEENSWTPETPLAFALFYESFLAWRAANQWDNRMADHLPTLFKEANLEAITEHDDSELSLRGDPAFDSATAIWAHVMESLGPTVVSGEFLSNPELESAKQNYVDFRHNTLTAQRLSIRTVIGSRQSI